VSCGTSELEEGGGIHLVGWGLWRPCLSRRPLGSVGASLRPLRACPCARNCRTCSRASAAALHGPPRRKRRMRKYSSPRSTASGGSGAVAEADGPASCEASAMGRWFGAVQDGMPRDVLSRCVCEAHTGGSHGATG
jgi:hypothetical protein